MFFILSFKEKVRFKHFLFLTEYLRGLFSSFEFIDLIIQFLRRFHL